MLRLRWAYVETRPNWSDQGSGGCGEERRHLIGLNSGNLPDWVLPRQTVPEQDRDRGAISHPPGSGVMREVWQQVGFDLLMVAVGCVVILILFFVLT